MFDQDFEADIWSRFRSWISTNLRHDLKTVILLEACNPWIRIACDNFSYLSTPRYFDRIWQFTQFLHIPNSYEVGWLGTLVVATSSIKQCIHFCHFADSAIVYNYFSRLQLRHHNVTRHGILRHQCHYLLISCSRMQTPKIHFNIVSQV